MQELLRGDLGNSISTKRPITEELAGRIPATLELLFSGMFIAILFGVPLGVLSARWQGRPFDVDGAHAFHCRRFDARLFSWSYFSDRLFPKS
jgi:ABC-type antimicrobial peptide transport system permease subunit